MNAHRLRRRLARIFIYGFVLAFAGGVTLAGLWWQGPLKHWLQARVVELYLKQVQPHLPFEIEDVEADAPFGDLVRGHIKSLRTTVRWGHIRAHLWGPIELSRPDARHRWYSIKFETQATLESVGDASGVSDPLRLDIYAKAPADLSEVTELKLAARASHWQWQAYQIDLDAPSLATAWESGRAKVDLDFERLVWRGVSERELELSGTSLSAETALQLSPFALGQEGSFRSNCKRVRAHWRKYRLNLNLSTLPVRGTVSGVASPNPQFRAQVGPLRIGFSQGRVTWTTPPLEIRKLVAEIIRATRDTPSLVSFAGGLKTLDIRAGTIQSEGSFDIRSQDARGIARIRDGAVQIHSAALAARGIQIDAPFSAAHGIQAVASINDFYFRKSHSKLSPTELSLEQVRSDAFSPRSIKLRLGSLGREGQSGTLPLEVDGVPAVFGALEGTFGGDETSWELTTSLKLPSVAFEKIAHPFCFKGHETYPPAQIEADLPRIYFGPGTIDPDGQVTAHLFEGTVRADQVALYGLGSPAPEVDFDVDFDGIRLDQLGQWSGFGEVLGTLSGYAHDVTFQGWLPSHFDFSIDAHPLPPSTWIEFDPQAMYHLVNLFAGGALDHLPVIAHGGLFNQTFDPYFGWISRRLGGFDLKYFGFSLYSSSGTILLETHDVPEILRTMKKHYIFWGHRFKMPVQSDHYPVVMDEHGVARVFQFMVQYLKSIARTKHNPDQKHEENDPNCLPPVF